MEAAHEVAQATRQPGAQTAHGWNLSRWRADETPEAVRLVHHDRRGGPDAALLCVRTPQSCRWVYETAVRLAPVPTTLVVLEEENRAATPKVDSAAGTSHLPADTVTRSP